MQAHEEVVRLARVTTWGEASEHRARATWVNMLLCARWSPFIGGFVLSIHICSQSCVCCVRNVYFQKSDPRKRPSNAVVLRLASGGSALWRGIWRRPAPSSRAGVDELRFMRAGGVVCVEVDMGGHR